MVSEAGGGGEFADVLDRGRDDGSFVFGVGELEAHAAAHKVTLEHGASPGGTGDGDENGLRTVLGMAGDEGGGIVDQDGGVEMMLGLNLENGLGRKVFEEDTAFDFGLNDVAIDLVAEVEVGRERGQLGHGKVILVTV